MSAFITYLVAGLSLGAAFALMASGLVAVHRVTGVVNFAQGTFGVIGGLTAASLLRHGLPHGFAEALAVVVAALVGLLVGVVAIGKRGTPALSSLIITLGLGIFAYAVEVVIWGDQPISSQGVGGSILLAGAHLQVHRLVVIGAAVLTFVAMVLLFDRSYIGKAMTACASNPYAASLCGLNVRRMGLIAFVLGGALGGLTGVLLIPLQPFSFDSDLGLAVNGFAAAVFGGLTKPIAALVGALVLGVSQSMVAGYYSASYSTEVALGLMLVIIIARSSRLGQEEAR